MEILIAIVIGVVFVGFACWYISKREREERERLLREHEERTAREREEFLARRRASRRKISEMQESALTQHRRAKQESGSYTASSLTSPQTTRVDDGPDILTAALLYHALSSSNTASADTPSHSDNHSSSDRDPTPSDSWSSGPSSSDSWSSPSDSSSSWSSSDSGSSFSSSD